MKYSAEIDSLIRETAKPIADEIDGNAEDRVYYAFRIRGEVHFHHLELRDAVLLESEMKPCRLSKRVIALALAGVGSIGVFVDADSGAWLVLPLEYKAEISGEFPVVPGPRGVYSVN